MAARHGASTAALEDPARLPAAKIRKELPAPRGGWVAGMDAEGIGKACAILGAGRRAVTDAVDPAVGVSGMRKIGEAVSAGEPLLTVHANDPARLDEAMALLKDACVVSDGAQRAPRLIREVLTEEEE